MPNENNLAPNANMDNHLIFLSSQVLSNYFRNQESSDASGGDASGGNKMTNVLGNKIICYIYIKFGGVGGKGQTMIISQQSMTLDMSGANYITKK
jgi:hypothetical protein